MAVKYIKKAVKTPETDDHKTQAAVQSILNDIAKRKEEALKDLNKKFDKYEGEVIVSKEKISPITPTFEYFPRALGHIIQFKSL